MLDECIDDCDKAIEIDPMFLKAYSRKARGLIGQKKLTEAK